MQIIIFERFTAIQVQWLLLNFLLPLCIPTLAVADFTGPVVSVLDGDTIEVLHDQRPERIRLNGIDSPKQGQAFGQRAKQAASELVYGKKVTLQRHSYDKYKRTLADLLLPDGMNVYQALVKQGWCWSYRHYAPGDTALEGLKKEAREARKELWANLQPVPQVGIAESMSPHPLRRYVDFL